MENAGSRDYSTIMRNLNLLAARSNVPMIVLSQVPRSCEERPDKRPLLHDLREYGCIERMAEIILFLYRESYYNPACDAPNQAECIVAKNHINSGTGTINFDWEKNYD